MESNKLVFISDWITETDKPNYRTKLYLRLDDECKNGVCDFHYRVEQECKANGRWVFYYSGDDVDFVRKFFPAVVPFLDLDNCNFEGKFHHTVENGVYYLKNLDRSKVMEIFHISEEEYHQLLIASEEKEFFAYQLNSLGILKRWKKHADEFIALLERMTGYIWVNPYEGKPVPFDGTVLTKEQTAAIEEKIAQGYYSEENILSRKNELHAKKVAEKKADTIKEFDMKIASVMREKELAVSILDAGILSRNYIYYGFKNEVVFNWSNSDEAISEKAFQEYVEKYGSILFPKIKFTFKKQ